MRTKTYGVFSFPLVTIFISSRAFDCARRYIVRIEGGNNNKNRALQRDKLVFFWKCYLVENVS